MLPDRDLNKLYPDIKTRLMRVLSVMKEQYAEMFLVEGLRDHQRQFKLYKQGRSGPGKIVTNAQPGDSWHQYGLACDLAFTGPWPYADSNPWDDFVRVAEGFGFESGAKFKFSDKPHIQLRYGLTLEDVKQLYKIDGLNSVWAKIDGIRGVPPGSEWLGPQVLA